ncbi:hypothetical protein [Alloactinosynnema sp. L-07]|uniref:hypothetical protein n=1 Tax=Alloactinosynnema sp. L-07 TaxID=1653480 RepID=UPI00065F0729|nr:hypothetical protein [Alloactinosynnema sp. L-07]CRK56470.1 hypothetical protein [Alloactinosynnema sp. L-07]
MLDWSFTHLPWLWLGFVVVGASFLRLVWTGVVVLRAADVGYDPAACAARRPMIDLVKARRRRHSWPRLALPLFVLLVALFVTQLLWMNLFTYTLIAIAWFLTAPVRKIWGIAVARRVHVENWGVAGPVGFWRDVRGYYALGTRMPSKPADQVWFVGKYRWLNKFQNAWYIVQVYRFWGVVAMAAASLFWPVVAAVAIAYHLDEVDDADYFRPWWRFDRDARPDDLEHRQDSRVVSVW